MKDPFFSIVTVTLNPGEDLVATRRTIEDQDFDSAEWLVKDGRSQPGQLDGLRGFCRFDLRVIDKTDTGIFDAMNQALELCRGEFVIFMNAGDGFSHPHVLRNVARIICESGGDIFYGNYDNLKWKTTIIYPAELTRKYLYRRIPCHQAVFTRRTLLQSIGGFRANDFPIVADHEAMLRIALKENRKPHHLPLTCCFYKDNGAHTRGDGFSNREIQRQKLRREYFSFRERFSWGLVYAATLPYLRTWLTVKLPPGRLSAFYLRVLKFASRTVNR